MTLYPAEAVVGGVQHVILGTDLSNIAAGDFSAFATGAYDWATLGYPAALIWISIAGFGATPGAGGVVEVYGLPRNFGVSGNDNTNPPSGTDPRGAIWLGKIDIYANSGAQKRSCKAFIDSDMYIYLRNRTTVTLTASGSLVDMWPLSYGIDA